MSLSALVLSVSVQHFYAYRIYRLGGGCPYLPAAISVTSLTEFGIGIVYSAKLSAVVARILFLVFSYWFYLHIASCMYTTRTRAAFRGFSLLH
ncbi:hypothetical protein EDB89DRAFT_653582 [Lactarius sanguifluus]|nr:hypothetical protein EDB89DRAFT_653582 [Lactarius sanguifluus]